MSPSNSPTPSNAEVGVLRLDIDGHWTVKEFADLLIALRTSYVALNTLDYLARRAEDDKERVEGLLFGVLHGNDPKASLDLLSSISLSETADLGLFSTQYNSPGWVEVIGSWNPLKVICETIIEWRKQGTERERIRSEERRQREELHSQERRENDSRQNDLYRLTLGKYETLKTRRNIKEFEELLALVHNLRTDVESPIYKDIRVRNVEVCSPEKAREKHIELDHA